MEGKKQTFKLDFIHLDLKYFIALEYLKKYAKKFAITLQHLNKFWNEMNKSRVKNRTIRLRQKKAILLKEMGGCTCTTMYNNIYNESIRPPGTVLVLINKYTSSNLGYCKALDIH